MSKCLLAPQSKKVRSLELIIEEIRQAKDELIRMNVNVNIFLYKKWKIIMYNN